MFKVNVCKGYYPLDIEKCEEKYNAKYIGDFQTKNKSGEWIEFPIAIFYCPTPDINKGHSNYLGLFMEAIMTSVEPLEFEWGNLSITNGLSAVEDPFTAIEAKDGELVISCFTHDYRTSSDGSVFIDGGRDYVRSSEGGKLVKLKIVEDKFELV